MSDLAFNTRPKVGDTFFLHQRQEAFADPESQAAHFQMEDCMASAKAWVREDEGDAESPMLVMQCRVVGAVSPDGVQEVAPPASEDYQDRVRPWLHECFGPEVAGNKAERNHRFMEEALELVQSLGCTREDVLKLVDYVFGRPVGDPPQEVGGVMVTLAGLCLAQGMNMHQAGDDELARVWTVMDRIRAKNAAKPRSGPLPGQDWAGEACG
jgi:hypothetical protein